MITGICRMCTRNIHILYRPQLTASLQFCSPIIKYSQLLRTPHAISSVTVTRNFSSEYIPPPPSPPVITESIQDISQTLNALGEPTLSSLGLATWYPNGFIQYGLEMIHVGLDVPWWTSIAIGTVILRIATFPLVVIGQKNSAALHNHMPIIQKLQAKFDKAKRSNNSMETAKSARNLYHYMKEHEVKPVRNFIVPMIQMPIFISVFVGIKQMANLPVPSMASGGWSWFLDLTTPDPFFILPVLTMFTFFATVELGVDGVKANAMSKSMKMFMRALPFCIFPFTLNFPAGLLLYWLSSNSVSLVQVLLLKVESIRSFIGIPQLVRHKPSEPSQKVPFLQEIKNNWKKSRSVVNVEEMQRMEAVKFKEAGMGAIPKTYTYDPTKK